MFLFFQFIKKRTSRDFHGNSEIRDFFLERKDSFFPDSISLSGNTTKKKIEIVKINKVYKYFSINFSCIHLLFERGILKRSLVFRHHRCKLSASTRLKSSKFNQQQRDLFNSKKVDLLTD